jgi:hypothetical protein
MWSGESYLAGTMPEAVSEAVVEKRMNALA